MRILHHCVSIKNVLFNECAFLIKALKFSVPLLLYHCTNKTTPLPDPVGGGAGVGGRPRALTALPVRSGCGVRSLNSEIAFPADSLEMGYFVRDPLINGFGGECRRRCVCTRARMISNNSERI